MFPNSTRPLNTTVDEIKRPCHEKVTNITPWFEMNDEVMCDLFDINPFEYERIMKEEERKNRSKAGRPKKKRFEIPTRTPGSVDIDHDAEVIFKFASNNDKIHTEKENEHKIPYKKKWSC